MESFCERCYNTNPDNDWLEIPAGDRLITVCEDCYEVMRVAAIDVKLQQPVIVWRDRPQPVPKSEPAEEDYTIAEVADILKISANHAIKLFRNEAGVYDLASRQQGQRLSRKRHKSALRIPRAVLERVKLRRGN